MKPIKLTLSACIVALAAMAIGASAASARAVYQADGTTVAASGTKFTGAGTGKMSNSFLTDNCNMNLAGAITNNGTDNNAITSGLSSVTFTNCTYPTTANNVSRWLISMPQTGNPGSLTGADATIQAFGATCKYHTDATHKVNATWTNGSPSKIALSGTVALYSGSAFLCGSTGNMSGTGTITSTSTPGNNLLILPAP
jgi:hypothetical protein